MPSSPSLCRVLLSSFLFVAFGLGVMSFLFPLSDFFTPSPFVCLGFQGSGDSNTLSTPTSQALPDGSPQLTLASGSSSSFAPDPSTNSFFLPSGSSGAPPTGTLPSSFSTFVGPPAAFDAAGAFGAPPFFFWCPCQSLVFGYVCFFVIS
ncbi:hypothetical protein M407DRAFT_26473 [Tulasnella calospora MUT 4182]|uniref:Uncharacterized protein n=1 Tax=Tulasnella calospora MUT 4182 TaxID=1051891 RepID=A0A0C3LRS3_9AGAM|nr:hypothetical protein M407DRAFT_26473 [Tulasnella calospora MUT 4182]